MGSEGWGWGLEEGVEARSDGEGANPDLEDLQAGCDHSVLRKSISVSNGPGVEKFPVVGSGRWDSERVPTVLMTGLSIRRFQTTVINVGQFVGDLVYHGQCSGFSSPSVCRLS